MLKWRQLLGSRLVVGQQILALPAGVRIPAPQLNCLWGITIIGVPYFFDLKMVANFRYDIM